MPALKRQSQAYQVPARDYLAAAAQGQPGWSSTGCMGGAAHTQRVHAQHKGATCRLYRAHGLQPVDCFLGLFIQEKGAPWPAWPWDQGLRLSLQATWRHLDGSCASRSHVSLRDLSVIARGADAAAYK